MNIFKFCQKCKKKMKIQVKENQILLRVAAKYFENIMFMLI